MKNRKQTTWELYAKTIRMRAAEKRALRERLVSYMEYHPVRVPLADAMKAPEGASSPLLSESFVTFRFSSWQFRTFAGVFMLFLMVGVPAYAEYAMPGDILYPMKVRVNEEVKASLTWDAAEKIAWQGERVERRIAEARLLLKEGKLTDETEAAIALTVREHTESASREIEALRTTDAEGAEVAQVGFESTIDVQTAVLQTDADDTTASTSIDALALTVLEARVGVGAHDPAPDASLSYEKFGALLENETTRARELFETVKGSVSETERTDIERRLIDIERSIGDARTLHETGKQTEAVDSQRSIFGDIGKLISYMTDIDVRSTVALETLVPKKLTPDEYLNAVSADLEALKNQEVVARTNSASVTDKDVKKKYEQGLNDLAKLIESVETARSEAQFENAFRSIGDARALIVDLALLKNTAPALEGGKVVKEETGSTTPETVEVVSTTTATTTDVE